MKFESVLCLLKAYPQEYAQTAIARSETTPSSYNRGRHKELALALKGKDWDVVVSVITDPQYQNALEGVLICANSYSDLDNEIICQGMDLFREGKLVVKQFFASLPKDRPQVHQGIDATLEYNRGGISWESVHFTVGHQHTTSPQLAGDVAESTMDPEDDE